MRKFYTFITQDVLTLPSCSGSKLTAFSSSLSTDMSN